MLSPFKVNPNKKSHPGVEAGDPYYHTAKIVQVIKDDAIKLEVIDDKTSIQDTIDAYKDKAGLKNILVMYSRTGDKSLFEARSCLNGIDATDIPGNPELLAKSLPAELVAGKSIDEIKNLTLEDLIKFYSKESGSSDDDKEGGNDNE